eukprot:CAMPEP_0201620226 /NCGR_PEP_ID=MMETSP0492-20130828/43574_1 /ASSEMBLY_ACC=CAM_ASM_000837 /TAXON_ID=420259 /ORGANISM="Thalassiosira gravida, Strain GMp14c1" /LENGTH=304 /DNA_ID=CAMNT_0048089357 /DNA_START=120 /DNA_END=1034 /DNA_ORIENTATION=-
MSKNHSRNYFPPIDEKKETSSPSASSPSSSPLPSASLSSLELPARGLSTSSCSILSSSSPLADSSSTSCLNDEKDRPSLELVIQYGRGQCPYSFLPPPLLGTSKIQRNEDADTDDSSESIILSIPIESPSEADNEDIQSTDASATSRITNNNKSTPQFIQRVRVRWYRFLPSLSAEMERADVILTHAGAGTLLEALDMSSSTKTATKRKIINAVINNKLMNNHQSELAEELERREHILVTRDCTLEWTTEDDATKLWEEMEVFSPKPFLGGQSSRNDNIEQRGQNDDEHVSNFQRIVDRVMGFS